MKLKRRFFALATVVIILGAGVIGTAISSGDKGEQVKRGEYLVDLGGCNMCHTPKIMTSSGKELDQSRLLSGHPQDDTLSEYTTEAENADGQVTKSNFHMTQWSGPWGVSYAANLTPDKETGIGNWSEDTFIKTIRTGRHMGSGRQIQLPMPVNIFAQFSDADLKAIFAYLHSIKPIKNRVPPSIPAKDTEGGDSK